MSRKKSVFEEKETGFSNLKRFFWSQKFVKFT